MRLLIKLVALGVLAAMLTPALAPDSAIGQFVRAAAADAATFCQRRPDACVNGIRAFAEARDFIAAQVDALTQSENTLTAEDRAIRPAPAPDPSRPAVPDRS